jgi:hypothetical protein
MFALNYNLCVGVVFFLFANIIAWFQFNGQFLWSEWQDKPFLTNLFLAVPTGMCFWYAVRHIFLYSGDSNFVFAILTYTFLKESMFTPKTLACLILASFIIAIQIFWK